MGEEEGINFKNSSKIVMLSNMKKRINGVNKIKIIMMERIHMIG